MSTRRSFRLALTVGPAKALAVRLVGAVVARPTGNVQTFGFCYKRKVLPTKRAPANPFRWLPALLLLCLPAVGLAQTQIEQMQDLLDRGYYNSAARVVGPALVESHPEDPGSHLLHSQALYLVGEISAAREAYGRAARLVGESADSDPRYLHMDGLLSAAEGSLDRAIELLRTAFELGGTFDHGMDWGRIAWQAFRLEEALEAYRAVAETEEGSRSPWPHLNRGRILAYLDRFEDAIAAYRTAIEVFEQHDTGEARPSPAYVEAYYRLGEIYEQLGMGEESNRYLQLAMDHYRAALTGDPNYAPAIEALDSLSRRLP